MNGRFGARHGIRACLVSAALLWSSAVFGSTVNPIAIDLQSGGTYLSTDYDALNLHASFAADNEVQLFTLDLSTTALVYIQTISWAGLGGFTPELTLYNGDGTATGIGGTSSPGTYPDCGSLGVAAAGPDSSACLDAFISAVLDPGQYLLVLTQIGNDPLGNFSDGFTYDSNNLANTGCTSANYTGNSDGCLGYGGAGAFYAAYSTNPELTGTWALSIGTPEPASVFLVFSGLAGVMAFKRRSILKPCGLSSSGRSSEDLNA